MSEDIHARYADWDAAYILGSLSRAERAEYEAHLEGCLKCRTAITDLTPLPGLLARLDQAEALALLEEAAPVAPTQVVELPRRRGPRRLTIAFAAAAVALVAMLVPTLALQSSPSAAAIALHQTVPNPLTASVRLTATSWGTRIDMACTYAASYTGADTTYRLYVLDQHGKAWLVSSWRAGPGDVARTTGSSDLSPSQIAAVQVRSDSGKVLLSGQA